MAPIIRKIDPAAPDERYIDEMAAVLKRGDLIVFPTETFYGIGADALNPSALENVFELKSRPKLLPLLCLIDGFETLGRIVEDVPPWVREIMDAFWPGPLTLVLPAGPNLPAGLVGLTGGVGVRWTPNETALSLIRKLGSPVVGTSANVTGRPACSEIEDLDGSVLLGVQGVLDAGKTPGGLASTVLDCMSRPAKILREGAVSEERLKSRIDLDVDGNYR